MLPLTAVAEDRLPAVAGGFYPADSAQLAAMVHRDLDQVTDLPEIDGRILALVVPHAGLIYSGPVAAYSYKLLEGSGIDEVIICGPSHHYPFQGSSVYGPGVTWHTPLGSVPCDDKLCQALADKHGIEVIPAAHAKEHSVEVQLPFLQTVLSNFRIVPVVMAYQNKQAIDNLASALASLDIDEHTVMIASSDWQHYRPASIGEPLDSRGIACLQALDPDRLIAEMASEKVEMCGGGLVAAVTKAAIKKGANRARLLRYGDSGDISGDKHSVVGYAAIVIYRQEDKRETKADDPPIESETSMDGEKPYTLSNAERDTLLRIARQSISEYLATGRVPEKAVPGKLSEPGAAFVTLEKKGMLRGCIGYTQAVAPLYRTVTECAVKAATEDPRFRPLSADELDSLDIEISVLTPLTEVKSLDEIKVGRDGLMIVRGRYRGLLLPQVATDYGWDRDTFLKQTCHKAGLPENAYLSPDAVLYRFQALVFGEREKP